MAANAIVQARIDGANIKKEASTVLASIGLDRIRCHALATDTHSP